jgi:hypothetical protein
VKEEYCVALFIRQALRSAAKNCAAGRGIAVKLIPFRAT